MKVKRGQVDFPGGPVVKNPPCNAENADSIPGQGRVHTPQGYLSPWAAVTETQAPRARALQQEKSVQREPTSLPTAPRERPRAAVKTQHSQKYKEINIWKKKRENLLYL